MGIKRSRTIARVNEKNIVAIKNSELKMAYKIELIFSIYVPVLAYVLNIGYKFVR